MRVLLSTIGSRGDVQPLVALGLQLKYMEQDVHFCVPPDFRAWIESLGMTVTPIGPELRTQFETIAEAARDCQTIVGATALQIAAPSVAEKLKIPYIFAAYSPNVLPSIHHAPPILANLGEKPATGSGQFKELWARDSEFFQANFGAVLNQYRAAVGLPPVLDVRTHIFTDQPWLASDPVLGPWPEAADENIFQTGAWMLRDQRPLSPEIQAFLEQGEAPIYFDFGGMEMIAAARAVGRRAILSRVWAGLTRLDKTADCLLIDDVNQQALFKRVAAVVHHGGAGTTTAAAQAGAAQLIIPQMYDQYYWAQRVEALGVGVAHAPGTPTLESLTEALQKVLVKDIAVQARETAISVRSDGALGAARSLIAMIAS